MLLDEFIKNNSNELKDNCVLLIVCNTKSDTIVNGNYDNFSINTEFLSDDELQEITSMAVSLDLPFRIFYDEKDFIDNIITANNLDRFIVYNSAQNGVGPGRKALIPSICKYLNIRHTGSDSYRVCLCRDKFAIASILKANNIKVPKFQLYKGNNDLSLSEKTKYIAKPLYESSSIGISKNNIFYGNNIPYTYLNTLIKNLKQPLLIQEFISGYEIEVPILAGKQSLYAFSPVVLHKNNNSLIIGDEILDYNLIFNDDYTFSSLPNNINDKEVKETAIKTAELLGLNGLCRVDFRLKLNGEFFVTDVSTNPHFINHSSVNFAFKKEGKTDSDIFKTILMLS